MDWKSKRIRTLLEAALLEDKDELKRMLADTKWRPEAPPGMPIGEDDDGEF